jgi:hypothetical protein
MNIIDNLLEGAIFKVCQKKAEEGNEFGSSGQYREVYAA